MSESAQDRRDEVDEKDDDKGQKKPGEQSAEKCRDGLPGTDPHQLAAGHAPPEWCVPNATTTQAPPVRLNRRSCQP